MILERLEMAAQDFERQTGWTIGPEGACKEEVCIPLPRAGGPTLDVRMIAERLGIPLLHEEVHGVWCLGPDSGGKMLDRTLPEGADPYRVDVLVEVKKIRVEPEKYVAAPRD